MARRTVLPSHVKKSLNDRCLWESGLDKDAPVSYNGKNILSHVAENKPLSNEMMDLLVKMKSAIYDMGAMHVTVNRDPRRPESLGAVQILWVGDIEPYDVAEKFQVSQNEDGLPRIPSWISLRSENNFDLRWQSKSNDDSWL